MDINQCMVGEIYCQESQGGIKVLDIDHLLITRLDWGGALVLAQSAKRRFLLWISWLLTAISAQWVVGGRGCQGTNHHLDLSLSHIRLKTQHAPLTSGCDEGLINVRIIRFLMLRKVEWLCSLVNYHGVSVELESQNKCWYVDTSRNAKLLLISSRWRLERDQQRWERKW